MGRTRELRFLQPDRKWADQYLEVRFAGPKPDANYTRNRAGLLTHVGPGWKRDLLCKRQILWGSGELPCQIKGIERHRIRGSNSADNFSGWKTCHVHNSTRSSEN